MTGPTVTQEPLGAFVHPERRNLHRVILASLPRLLLASEQIAIQPTKATDRPNVDVGAVFETLLLDDRVEA
jgi:hypothetical protein